MRTHLKVLKALGDGSRLRIVKMLEVKPMCVCEITSVLKLAPSTVSKHLSILQEAGLIQDDKEGKWVNYALARRSHIPFAREMLAVLHRSLNNDPQIISDAERASKVNRLEICA